MLTNIAILLFILVAGLLAFVATKPNAFRIARTASIAAPPERVFTLINDIHNWTQWSPYEHIDPAMQRSYSGAASGKGAVYTWEGNKKVGSGRMEILESAPPGKVIIKLDFKAPFEAHNTAEFTVVPKGSGSEVTWAMTGASPFMMKLVGTFMNMDNMVGGQFAEGLGNLKRVAEA